MPHSTRVLALCLSCLLPLNLMAQTTVAPVVRTSPTSATSPASPVPGQITTAHTVFLANAGTDASFPIPAAQTYDTIYQALRTWGRYQLVATPEQADLIFTLRGIDPVTDYSYSHSYAGLPAYEIVITDTHSAVPLWTVDSPADIAGSKAARARWRAVSVTNLISRLKILAGENLSAQETANLTVVPKHHVRTTVAIVAGVAILSSGLVVGLIFRNYGKNQQDAFCKANNIPPSQCAGG